MAERARPEGGFVGAAIERAKRDAAYSVEIAAVAAVVTDLLPIIHALAPQAVEDVLRGRRIMLQDLQTKRRSPRVRREKLVQELAVELLETGLRRRGPPTTT